MTAGDIAYQLRAALGIEDIEKISLVYATVNSVDKAKRTCSVTTESTKQPIDMEDVMLMAANGDGQLMIPAKDSTVIVAFSEHVLPYVHMYSDIDEIVLFAGKMGINVKSGLIQLADGQYGGIPIVGKVSGNLSTITSYLNTLKSAISTALGTVDAAAGSVSKGTFDTTMATKNLNMEDMENKEVKHGKGK